MTLRVRASHLAGSLAGHCQRLALAPDAPLGLGRDPDCEVRFHDRLDDAVSRRHARLLHRDGRLLIEDLGSTNGTFVDGARCAPGTAVPVPDGAHIRLGALGPELQVWIEGSGPMPVAVVQAGQGPPRDGGDGPACGPEVAASAPGVRRRARRARWAALGLLAAGALGLTLWGSSASRQGQGGLGSAAPRELSWSAVEARASAATVRVESRYRTGKGGTDGEVRGRTAGCGVLIRPTLVLTAARLVRPWDDPAQAADRGGDLSSRGARPIAIWVQLPGHEPVPATLFALAAEADLALLQVPLQSPAAMVAVSEMGAPISVGQEVALMLHPKPAGAEADAAQVPAAIGAGWSSPSALRAAGLPPPHFSRASVSGIGRYAAGQISRVTLAGALGAAEAGSPVFGRRGELIGLTADACSGAGEAGPRGVELEAGTGPGASVEIVPSGAIRRFLARVGLLPTMTETSP